MPTGPPPRVLGFWMCLALVMGNMIGSGIFLLPASLAPYGWNSVIGWTLTILGGMALAMVFAALARALPQAGGPYAYTKAAFGPLTGFLIAWSYWVSLWAGNAGVAIGAVSYVTSLWPGLATVSGLPAALTCALVWLFTAVNCLGVQSAGRVQVVTMLVKLVPLALVLAVAVAIWLRQGSAAVLPLHAADLSVAGVGATATLTLWGLLGLESATVPAVKVRDAARNIPRATIIGTAATGLIYLLVCSAVTLLAPAETIAGSGAPLAAFVGLEAGPWGARLVVVLAAIATIGALNGWIMLQGEMPAAMARDGVFPAWLGRLSPRGAPVNAHLASSGLLTMVLLFNYTRSMTQLFTFIVLLATTASLFAYLACALAALKLARGIALGTAMRIVAGFAVLYALWTLWGAGLDVVGWGLLLVALGLPVHLAMRRAKMREAMA